MAAVAILEKHLGAIPHPTAGPNNAPAVLKLVGFTHQSPGIAKVRRQLAEGLVALLEANGIVLSVDATP